MLLSLRVVRTAWLQVARTLRSTGVSSQIQEGKGVATWSRLRLETSAPRLDSDASNPGSAHAFQTTDEQIEYMRAEGARFYDDTIRDYWRLLNRLDGAIERHGHDNDPSAVRFRAQLQAFAEEMSAREKAASTQCNVSVPAKPSSKLFSCVSWKTVDGREGSVRVPIEDLDIDYTSCKGFNEYLFANRPLGSFSIARLGKPSMADAPEAGASGDKPPHSGEADEALLGGKYHVVSAGPEKDEVGEGERIVY